MFDYEESVPELHDNYPVMMIRLDDTIRVVLSRYGLKLIGYNNLTKLTCTELKEPDKEPIPIRMFKPKALGPASATFEDSFGNVYVIRYQIVSQDNNVKTN